MLKTIDWSKAPEWADKHGFIGLCPQAVWLNSSRYAYVDGQQGGRDFLFVGSGYPLCSVRDITTRPTTPSWSGEGLPPVGADIEFKSVGGEWVEGQYIGQFNGLIVAGCNQTKSVGYLEPGEFRPIRTPEQIAAEDRRDAVARMSELTQGAKHWPDAFGMLYDAGYIKP